MSTCPQTEVNFGPTCLRMKYGQHIGSPCRCWRPRSGLSLQITSYPNYTGAVLAPILYSGRKFLLYGESNKFRITIWKWRAKGDWNSRKFSFSRGLDDLIEVKHAVGSMLYFIEISPCPYCIFIQMKTLADFYNRTNTTLFHSPWLFMLSRLRLYLFCLCEIQWRT